MKKILLLFSSVLAIAFVSHVNAQISYVFTTGGATGQSGPTQAQLNAAYAGTNLQGNVTSSSGIQLWTVPTSGIYSIEAKGAQGGNQGSFTGGLGASIYGEVALNAGEIIEIVVGQRGITGSGSAAGGAGGSFVVRQTGNVPLIIAGGGSGSTSNGPNGNPGLTTINGGSGDNCSGNGGTGGNGGGDAAACGAGAGGAGGFLSDGSSAGTWGVQRGYGFVNGAGGGSSSSGGSVGGFGGGAGTHTNNTGGGAGGGYSGGGAPFHNNGFNGGGGGSFNGGMNPLNIAGANAGQGSVVITPLTSPAPNNAGVVFFVNPTFTNNTVCSGITTVEAAIQNFGSNQINSLDIDWTFGGVAQPTFSYTSLLDTFGGAAGSIDTVTLGTINITGNSELVAWTSMPNGNVDTINNNDTSSLAIDSVINVLLDLGPDKTVCDGNFTILENVGSNQNFSSYNWSTGASSPTIITNTPGTYSLTVTYGPPQCVAADQIVVTAGANPVIELGADTTLCANEYTLDAGGDGTTYVWSDGNNTQTNTVTVSGNYSVTVTNSEGCISEADINLTMLETPVVDLGEDFKLCISYDQTQLISAGNSFESYIWSTGATTPNIVVGAGVTTVGNQTYSVTVTADNGCTGEDAVVVEYSMCVGINENVNNSNVSLFPNPATDLVTFTAEGTSINEVQIFDLTGKMIFNNLPASDRLDVNTSEFASGTYIVKVITNNESVTRRLIVE